jgi:protocatechuate 3,4-dioxygenase beta subunit
MLLRRRVLEGGIVVAAGLGLSRLASAAALPATPAQTAGPFYPLTLPADSDNDLIHVADPFIHSPCQRIRTTI